ncbi:unnamed protein product [Parascedosporium putredinis]|uniref:Nitrate reductase [NADPH] n=1 Tax=Parascedosporium putredinis TaxID=1442378 RepID=A0A9P1M8I1_9PEZI|nr:unnamed protein product [Parascedosporium putredinis]CAI7993594.1 unnamed protein product [Parascedosporium putredinis]
MPRKPWVVRAKEHPGATFDEIQDEPAWESGHNHRVGFRNKENRFAGFTHGMKPLSLEEEERIIKEARKKWKTIQDKQDKGDLVNWRDIVGGLHDFHLVHPEQRPHGWRYVLEAQEDWVKFGQPWPANAKLVEQAKKDLAEKEKEKGKTGTGDGSEKGSDSGYDDKDSSGDEASRAKRTPAIEALWREKEYISNLGLDNGLHDSPLADAGKDRDPAPEALLDAGLITPNELHYVRNHGAVPRILWEFHQLDIQVDGGAKMVLSMDDLVSQFRTINIPVLLGCDGNRRGEMNRIRKSKGFTWGPAGVSCAYWRGPLLRDVLLEAGQPDPFGPDADPNSERKLWMNNEPLPADHGYPVRVVIPGFVGGRCVKWLSKIWVSDRENESYYHIFDNRVLPSHITDNGSDEAKAMYHNPDTACNEQVLNSVIAKPAHGERLPLKSLRRGDTYRVEGFAFSGGGHAVQRVELSLDGGETWRYCERRFPDRPLRHGRKAWAWVFWHADVPVSELAGAHALAVRAWNALKCTQPERPTWNIMGMMNNCWYQVKPEITSSDDAEEPYVLFRHPVELESKEPGWMRSSAESRVEAAKIAPADDQKRITRQEVEKHDKQNDCWIVVEGNVYDATSVLSWHPGGKATILSHGGKVHQETTDEFDTIHDNFARKKLQECLVEISGDTRAYTFQLPEGKMKLGMNTCQHVEVGFHLLDKMVTRQYTPTRPFLPAPDGVYSKGHDLGRDYDGNGTFELTVKTYFPNENQPGGAMSNILDLIPVGEEIEIRGPLGEIEYHGHGHDKTEIRLVDANNTESDILMREELERFQEKSGGKFKLAYVLSKASEEWAGYKSYINGDIIRENLFAPDKDSIVIVCGPPAMIAKAVLPALTEWGYVEEQNLYGF